MAIFAKAALHPFLGEHANASAVHHENGSVSMRLGAKKSRNNKYKDLMSEEHFEQPEKGVLNVIYDVLFGFAMTDQEKMAKEYSEHFGRKTENHKKLGANFPAILQNTGNFIFTG